MYKSQRKQSPKRSSGQRHTGASPPPSARSQRVNMKHEAKNQQMKIGEQGCHRAEPKARPRLPCERGVWACGAGQWGPVATFQYIALDEPTDARRLILMFCCKEEQVGV